MSISKDVFLLVVFLAWGTIKAGEGWTHYPRNYVANAKDDRDSEFSLDEKNLPKEEESSKVQNDEDSGEEYMKDVGLRGVQKIRLSERTRRCEPKRQESELVVEDSGEPKLAGIPDEAEYRSKEDVGSAPVASWQGGKCTTCQPKSIQELAKAYKCMVMAAKQFIKAANKTEDEPSPVSDGSTEASLYEHRSRRKKVSETGAEEEASSRRHKSPRTKSKGRQVPQSEEQAIHESSSQNDQPSNPAET